MKLLFLLSALLLFVGCTTQHREIFIHLGDIDEEINSEHVQYRDGVLMIDNQHIVIPDGERLSIRHTIKGKNISFTVKVDGKVVAKNKAAETAD